MRTSTLYLFASALALVSGCNSRPDVKPAVNVNGGRNFENPPSRRDDDLLTRDGCLDKNNCAPLNLRAQIGGNHQIARDGVQKYWFSEVNVSVNWLIQITGAQEGRALMVFSDAPLIKMLPANNENTWRVAWVPTGPMAGNLNIFARDLKRCQISGGASTDCNAPVFNSTYDFRVTVAFFVQKLTQTQDPNGNFICQAGAVADIIGGFSTKIDNATNGILGDFADGLSRSGNCSNFRNYTQYNNFSDFGN